MILQYSKTLQQLCISIAICRHIRVCVFALTENTSAHVLPGLVSSHWVACQLLGYILTCHRVPVEERKTQSEVQPLLYQYDIKTWAKLGHQLKNVNCLHEHYVVLLVAFLSFQQFQTSVCIKPKVLRYTQELKIVLYI